MTDASAREAVVGADALDDWTVRFVAQLAAPRAQRFQMSLGGGDTAADVLLDVEAGSWAALYREGSRWLVRQGGPGRVWDEVEDYVARWRRDGAPGLDRFLITATPDHQSISWAT
ncbi:hypothetical protein ACWCXB_07700 [Streptomyces sp. NPDC001514]